MLEHGLEHGGRLREAARQWNIPLADWLDLSTGIASWSYPVQISADAWQRLPEDDDALVASAAAYYRHACHHTSPLPLPLPLPLPGSQAAIQWLPRLIAPGRVVVPANTYGEYAPAWRAAGHQVSTVPFAALLDKTLDAEVIMLANPNNPTGECFAAAALAALANQQAQRGGWLIIDAAFGDAQPVQLPSSSSVILLHSLGKFFGLAGARVGFCCAPPTLQNALAAALGPWALANPSRQAAMQALSDTTWQAAQRQRLAEASTRLSGLLRQHELPNCIGGTLFCYAPTAQAATLHAHFAQRGILLRRFDHPPAVRFGLPGNASDWQRLEAALSEWNAP
jgi:L-threonine-O-3-phosphate decarboxylase